MTSDDEDKDNVYHGIPLLTTGRGGAAPFCVNEDDNIPGTPSTVVIPDSFVPLARFQLPQAPHASMPPGQRQAHDRLKPSWVKVFNNVHRFYDDKSRAIAHVAWEFVDAQEVWAIVTCKFIGAGKLETMAWFKNTAVSWVHDLLKKFVSMANDVSITQKVPIPSFPRFLSYSSFPF